MSPSVPSHLSFGNIILAVVLLSAGFGSAPAAAQLNPIAPACQVGTLSQQADCQAKLLAYQSYVGQLGAGVTRRSLPQLYRDVLGPHYPGTSFANHLFGYANRQPPNNATTDCSITYYNDASMVTSLAAGTLSDGAFFGWLLHELAHVEQCNQVGGRDRYARLWFDQLQQTQISVTWPPNAGTLDWMQIHDQMAMEQQADAKRDAVWSAINTCCIDQSGQLIRPLVVTSLDVTNDPATATKLHPNKVLTVQSTGGAHPLAYQWQIRKPGQTSFQNVGAVDGSVSGATFTWVGVYSTGSGATAQLQVGTYHIKVLVSQARPALSTEQRSVAITVSPPKPPIVAKPPADQ